MSPMYQCNCLHIWRIESVKTHILFKFLPTNSWRNNKTLVYLNWNQHSINKDTAKTMQSKFKNIIYRSGVRTWAIGANSHIMHTMLPSSCVAGPSPHTAAATHFVRYSTNGASSLILICHNCWRACTALLTHKISQHGDRDQFNTCSNSSVFWEWDKKIIKSTLNLN